MNLKCYCFHKSGSMFLFKLFKKISKDNNIDYYSINKFNSNEKLWNKSLNNCIICPLRYYPDEYQENLKYILHLRNPLDVLISQYYSFGFTHKPPSKKSVWYSKFISDRKKIQSQTIDEYCLSQENIDEINDKYNKMLNWIKINKEKENVFISYYDDMYYDFPNWLKQIFEFLSLKTYNETLSFFKNEFKNSNKDYVKTNIKKIKKSHHRSGLSKQYLVELEKKTLDLVISKFSRNIKNNFDFT